MRRGLGAVGRVLTTLGALILIFVAYQLWGTSIYTDRLQDELAQDFATALERAPDRTSTTTTSSPTPTPSSTTTTTTTPPPPPPIGEAVAQIRIPKIGLDNIVVNGTSREDLRKGPGHYPFSPMPGQRGNSAIAGHRTTYGAPFGNLDQLAPGDKITVRTLEGTFDFDVTEQLIVDPSDVSVLDPVHEDSNPSAPLLATLTLTTCNPKFSAAQRLVVKAQLSPRFEALPAPVELPKQPKLLEEGLSGDEGSKVPTILSGLVAAIVGALWWLVFHRHPRWTTWLMGAVPFAVVLFVFYVFLERVLPSNY